MKSKTRGNASERRMGETVESEINCQSLRQDKPEQHSAKSNWLGFQFSVTSNCELRFTFEKGILPG